MGFGLTAILMLECFHEEVIFMGRTFRFKYRYIHMNDMYIYFHKTRLMLFYFGRKMKSCHRIWVHLVSQDTDQCQNYLLILRWCRLSPGSEKRQLWPFFHFPMVITASRGCNIRGGEVIVNLFFFAAGSRGWIYKECSSFSLWLLPAALSALHAQWPTGKLDPLREGESSLFYWSAGH